MCEGFPNCDHGRGHQQSDLVNNEGDGATSDQKIINVN